MQMSGGHLLPPVQKLVATTQFASGKLAVESLILCIGEADEDERDYIGEKQKASSSASALPMWMGKVYRGK